MIKKILCIIIISCFAVSTFAADDSCAAQKQIADNCKSYLMLDTVPQNLGKHADAALEACYDNHSCTNDALLDVKHCTKKLLNWESTYSLPKVNDDKQKQATQKKTTTPAVATQNTTTSASPNSNSNSNANNAETTPVDFDNTNATTSTPSHNNTPSKKKPGINWF